MKDTPREKIKKLFAEYKKQIEAISRERDEFLRDTEKISKNKKMNEIRKKLKDI